MGRIVTDKVVPATAAKDLAAVATAMAADTNVDTAVLVPSAAAGGPVDTGIRHIVVTSEAEATAALAQTAIEDSKTAEGMKSFGSSAGPLLESNDANDAVSISRAAGATTIRFTATDADGNPNDNIVVELADLDGIVGATTPALAFVSTGVYDLAIDLAAGDNAGPYNVVVTATDKAGNVATVTTAVTSTA